MSFRNRARATLEDGGANSKDNMPSKELLSEHAGYLDSDIRVPPELAHSVATEPKGVLLGRRGREIERGEGEDLSSVVLGLELPCTRIFFSSPLDCFLDISFIFRPRP